MWVPTDPFFPCVSFLAAGACPVRELCVSWGWAPPEPPPARGTQRREKRGLLRTDLRPRTAPRGAELPFAPSCGQRSASVVPCQGVFAAGPGAVGSSGSAALSEGSTERHRARLGSAFWSPSLRGRCLSLAIQSAGQTPIQVVFCSFFCVACGLLGFAHPEKVRGVCVDMI